MSQNQSAAAEPAGGTDGWAQLPAKARVLIRLGQGIMVLLLAYGSCLLLCGLHVFAGFGDPVGVRIKLACGADIERRGEGGTALHHAARGGHAGVVRLLLDRGADVNARAYDGGATPLDVAASDEVRQVLRQRGGKPSAELPPLPPITNPFRSDSPPRPR